MRFKRFAFASALSAAAAFSQEFRITSGVADNQVFQRNAEKIAEIHLEGVAAGKKVNGKSVEAHLSTLNGATVPGFEWAPLGRVVKQKWTADVKRVPTGGPYRLDVRLQGSELTASATNILVGDLWLLAGQSNMEGHGDLMEVQPSVPLVHSFDMADRWLVAEEPLHTLANAADPVHWPLNAERAPERYSGDKLERYILNRRKGAGLGLPFAAEMLKRTGAPIGLIPCAHGGTSMEQWDPALKGRGGESLYGSMLRRFHAAGGSVRGVLWYQGESDANAKAAPEFRRRFESFVQAVRADFDEPDLPFYYVQIGRHVSRANMAEWNAVQEAQLRAEADLPRAGMAASVDLALDDGIHVSTPDLKRLARRLANLASRDLFARVNNFGELKRGPRPVSARYSKGMVEVSFSGVNGRLEAEGRIAGFSIHAPDGSELPLIYKAAIDPAEASVVRLYVQGEPPENASVWYGFGKDPYCNLRDAADMAAPVFGPLRIE